MASAAPTRMVSQSHRVAPLPRMGALLLVIIVVAAGISPIISWNNDTTSVETGSSATVLERTAPKDNAPLSILDHFPAALQAKPAAGETAAPAVVEEAVTP